MIQWPVWVVDGRVWPCRDLVSYLRDLDSTKNLVPGQCQFLGIQTWLHFHPFVLYLSQRLIDFPHLLSMVFYALIALSCLFAIHPPLTFIYKLDCASNSRDRSDLREERLFGGGKGWGGGAYSLKSVFNPSILKPISISNLLRAAYPIHAASFLHTNILLSGCWLVSHPNPAWSYHWILNYKVLKIVLATCKL